MKIHNTLLSLTVLLGLMAVSTEAQAQWSHESELGIIVVDGNSESQTTNAKQNTIYKWDKNSVDTKAGYTTSEQGGQKSAESWSASLRYERVLSEKLSAFLTHGAESDRFAGYLQRDNTDLGLKYTIYEKEVSEKIKDKWFVELGYRAIQTDFANSDETDSTSNARVYSEITHTFREGLSGKLWAEYVADVGDSEVYYVNAEPSLSVLLNNTLSLKVSYLVKYQNALPAGIAERIDTTYSTALVAKF